MKQLLQALRAYAQVDPAHPFHPTQDRLHYALRYGRWHLLHPDAPRERISEVHDRLGDPEGARDLTPQGRLEKRVRRVPVLTATDHRGHPYVVKGAEADAFIPRRGHKLGITEEMAETGLNAGIFTTRMLTSMGAPVIPVHRDRAWDPEPLNAAHGKEFFRDDRQDVVIMPRVHPDTEKDRSSATPWAQRLAGRLEAGEHLLNAPDRHAGNYVKVPAIGPDGRVEHVKHGLDYEWTGGGKNQHGVLETLDRTGNPFRYGRTDPHTAARRSVDDLLRVSLGLSEDTPTWAGLNHKQKGMVDALAAFPAAWDEHELKIPGMGDDYARGYALSEHLDPENAPEVVEGDPLAPANQRLAHFHALVAERDRLEGAQ